MKNKTLAEELGMMNDEQFISTSHQFTPHTSLPSIIKKERLGG
jgi:hypothetical protein